VVRVPGKQYRCTATFGLVIEKEIGVEHHVTVTTTSYGDPNAWAGRRSTTTIADEAYQRDVVWYRTLDGREATWTFRYGTFKVRPGHVVSAIGAQGEILMVMNHSTGQLLSYDPAIDSVNSLSCRRRGWAVASGIGSLGVFGAFFLTVGARVHGAGWVSTTLLSVLPSMVLSALFTAFIGWRYGRRMRARFRRDTLPALMVFLEQSSPDALQRFGAAR
jgi:hypothetical protein